MWNSIAIVACLLIPGDEVEPAPDIVTMKQGRALEGRVVFEDDTHLVLRVKSRDREIPLEKVESVRAAIRELPLALEAVATLKPKSIGSLITIGEQLEKQNLPLEARLVYWKALLQNPAGDAANLALGHRKRQKSWVIPHGQRRWRFDRLTEVRKDFGDAWEFDTTHYHLRTNLPLAQALDCALDLERFYVGFYRTFGPELNLREVTERMEVEIHATRNSFPQNGRSGYYKPDEGRIYIDASNGLRRSTLVHEGTHQLLDFTAIRMKPGKGKIPGWLNEGMAKYMEAAITGKSGELTIVPGEPDERGFAIHGTAKKPYGLKRVLNFQSDDFHASSKVALKYAQAYTLVSFCLHAEKERYREGFFTYLCGAYAGKSSSTHFKKAIGVKERDMEKAWEKYIRTGGR
jgi:hypothetical protein